MIYIDFITLTEIKIKRNESFFSVSLQMTISRWFLQFFIFFRMLSQFLFVQKLFKVIINFTQSGSYKLHIVSFHKINIQQQKTSLFWSIVMNKIPHIGSIDFFNIGKVISTLIKNKIIKFMHSLS